MKTSFFQETKARRKTCLFAEASTGTLTCRQVARALDVVLQVVVFVSEVCLIAFRAPKMNKNKRSGI